MTPTVRSIALAAVCALLPSIGAAQADDPMAQAARKALESNPDVTARVDAEAGAGRTEDRITSRIPASSSLDHNGVALSITQLLWDGTALTTQIRRLDHDRQTRWFELLDVSENTALEATRAYIDVVRYRKMVALSEDNYVDHRFYYQQIDSRYRAGVGRGVDVEQASARVALAESNLTTDISNLHDVVARYLRIVGEAPLQHPPRPQSFAAGLPTTATQAMDVALRNSAAINAAIESLRSARAAVGERESAFWPKVEARVRAGGGHNFDATPDLKRDVTAGVVLNWNLFAGGADQARVRQQTNLQNQAADLRDKACRDTQRVGDRKDARRIPPATQHRAAQPARPAELRKRALHRAALVHHGRLRPLVRAGAPARRDAATDPAARPARTGVGRRRRLRGQLERRRRHAAALPGDGGQRRDHTAERARPARAATARERAKARSLKQRRATTARGIAT